jgi:hypothetical protein
MLNQLIGRNVFVRTVTHHHTGRLASTNDGFLELADAAWIADDGRFADALATGNLNEVEPFPNTCWVNISAIIDICVWAHPLPRTQK